MEMELDASARREHEQLGAVLQVRLSNAVASPFNKSFTLLPSYASDHSLLSMDLLEIALMERVAMPFPAERSAFDYLVRCYERALSCPIEGAAPRIALFSALLLSDTGIVSPQQLKKARKVFLRLLSADSKRNRALPKAFIQNMLEDGEEERSCQWIVDALYDGLKPPLKGENALIALRGIEHLLVEKRTANVLVSHASWYIRIQPQWPVDGAMVSSVTLVGRALNLHYDLIQHVREQTRNHVDQWVESHRVMSSAVQDAVHSILSRLVVCGENSRSSMLNILQCIAVSNKARAQMRYNPKKVATDMFFINLGGVVLRLAKPIVQLNKKGTDRTKFIELHYALPQPEKSGSKAPLLELSGETRIGCTPEQLSALGASTSPEEFPMQYHFFTEIFFLTMRCLNIGIIKSLSALNDRISRLQDRQQMLERLSAMPSDPRRDFFLQRERASVDSGFASALLLRGHLSCASLLGSAATFYLGVAGWLTRLQDAQNPLLPALPEYIAADIIEFFFWLSYLSEEVFHSLPLSPLMSFVIAYLPEKSVLKNPHLRGKLPNLLLNLVPQWQDSSVPVSHLFIQHEGLLQHLVDALLDIFVEVEFTGRSNQFYEKFQSRHTILELLEFLWQYPQHRAKFRLRASDTSSTSFAKFLNMLINDAVWLLDESLKNLKTLREAQLSRADVASWSARSEEEREREDEEFRQNENYTKSMLKLANVGIRTLQYLTSDDVIRSIFVSAQFVSRMAEMLDYYVCLLVGPEVAELQVENRRKYNFEPRVLLKNIVETLINLSSSEDFLQAIVQDTRSYKPVLFQKALKTVKKHNLLSSQALVSQFSDALDRVSDLHSTSIDIESVLINPPDEFLDPIMTTLMRDPVILPVSRETVDRSVIERHLLNNPTDPFNRQPLSIEQVQPNTPLKLRIEQWIQERIQQSKQPQ